MTPLKDEKRRIYDSKKEDATVKLENFLTASLTTAYRITAKLITFQSTPWAHHLLASVPYFYATFKGKYKLAI